MRLEQQKVDSNVLVVVGSHRNNSQSLKVATHIHNRISELNIHTKANILELATVDIPFWDEWVWEDNNEEWKKAWTPVGELISKATSYVMVSPEYNGMVPAKLKNLLLLADQDSMGHKPALIVGVSASMGWSYPVNELRTSGYKNTKIAYIPEHVIVRKVEEVLNTPEANNEDDAFIRRRIDFALQVLDIYDQNFKGIRQSDFDFAKYPYGM
jgi:NAD(P)H-dependent FMN reductase